MTDAKRILEFERNGELRLRSPDKARARSLLEAAQKTAYFVCKIPLDEDSAGVVFRELYECLRQVGDAKMWLAGYEAVSHAASMAALEEDIGHVDYMKLDRLRAIRNNANYRGYRIGESNAQEMLVLWKKWGETLIAKLMRDAQ